jgi:hypothetical protein
MGDYPLPQRRDTAKSLPMFDVAQNCPEKIGITPHIFQLDSMEVTSFNSTEVKDLRLDDDHGDGAN